MIARCRSLVKLAANRQPWRAAAGGKEVSSGALFRWLRNGKAADCLPQAADGGLVTFILKSPMTGFGRYGELSKHKWLIDAARDLRNP
jgi:hypothetical protein